MLIKPIPLGIENWISYNPMTGDFTWKRSPAPRCPIGSTAGCIDISKGYYNIKFSGNKYRAHRIAWYLCYSIDPKDCIDHKNGIRHDNRLRNLRLASKSQNACNRSITKGASGIKGVSWHKVTQKWRVRIRINNTVSFDGYYDSLEQAEKIAIAKRLEFHGEFANS